MTVNSGASAPTSAGAPERIQEGTMTTDQPRLAAEAGLLTLDDVATMTGLAPGSGAIVIALFVPVQVP